jgi:hypothetical protein
VGSNPATPTIFSNVFNIWGSQGLRALRQDAAFAKALREALGLGPVSGVVAIDGKRLRRG